MGKAADTWKEIVPKPNLPSKLRRVIVPLVLWSVVFVPLALATDSPNPDHDGDNSQQTDSDPNTQSSSSSSNNPPVESAPLHNLTISGLPKNILDEIEDSFYDALSRDPSCDDEDCWSPPQSTVESEPGSGDGTCILASQNLDTAEETLTLDSSKFTPETNNVEGTCQPVVDKHWGSDPTILRMRDKLREAGSVASSKQENEDDKKKKTSIPQNKRPPVFLLPGLASTRLIAWKYKGCPQHPLLSDIKVLDIAWLNINLIFQMGTFESSCLKDCLTLGLNQSDTDDLDTGCKLRPDEGLDAISSLSPGGIGSDLLVGGTNTGKLILMEYMLGSALVVLCIIVCWCALASFPFGLLLTLCIVVMHRIYSVT